MNSPITLDALKVLEAIERKKSFAAAAESLFRVPSAVSYTVNKLEEDLGVPLFDRTKRKAELTPIGKMVVEQGRLILNATEELTHLVKQSASGWEVELRIGIDSILEFDPIYDLIKKFHIDHPWIDIKVREEVFGGTWDALAAERCDLVIGAAGLSHNKSFQTHAIGNIAFVFAVAKDHPLCNEPQPLAAEIIKQYPSVVVADSSQLLEARSAGLLDGQSRITVPTFRKKIELQQGGGGVGYLPVHRIQTELQTGQLVALPVELEDWRKLDLHIAWRKDNEGKALAWFVEELKAMQESCFLMF
ncbi:LysR family transcriptional regulator [Vibrio superstes]|uniref:LysR family transcriptional regulator n=1 Tax=Vibrio superstes NBRC 103154 TaxID=1219062 RepID=A0A511QQA1_9VIBR|nr:LysR family transcriptional regulator [Vibrio superstes]GEM79076.1 LysR family transcriptional regulator [Vibrio superstes NBRC 103154]